MSRAKKATPPPFRPVQLAQLVDTVPAGSGWLHEMKYDGYRLLIAVGGGEARAYTRSGLDWSDRFASLLAEAQRLKVETALIDGEAVVLDADGRSNFQSLQNALKGSADTIDYFAFDLLELDGEDLTGLPLTERKARQMDPDKFTSALPKAQRKGHIFVDYLRNQRGATAVMPYSARAREGAPVAAPITWKEMETIDKPSHLHVTDADELIKRAASKALQGWGRASQELPDL